MYRILDPLTRIRLQRGAERLHNLGPRAVAEALCEIADKIGGMPAVLEVLAEFERGSPEILASVGGDRFPPLLQTVPR